jgi:hypothetical protein
MDLGPPIASTALAEGTPVYDSEGRRIGVVDEVFIEPPGGIFAGLIIHTLPLPGRHVRAMPDQIAELRERGVLLAVGRDALHEEPGWRHRDKGGPPPPEPALERFARRVLDRLGGRR